MVYHFIDTIELVSASPRLLPSLSTVPEAEDPTKPLMTFSDDSAVSTPTDAPSSMRFLGEYDESHELRWKYFEEISAINTEENPLYSQCKSTVTAFHCLVFIASHCVVQVLICVLSYFTDKNFTAWKAQQIELQSKSVEKKEDTTEDENKEEATKDENKKENNPRESVSGAAQKDDQGNSVKEDEKGEALYLEILP